MFVNVIELQVAVVIVTILKVMALIPACFRMSAAKPRKEGDFRMATYSYVVEISKVSGN